MLSLCFAVPNEDTNLTAVDLSSSIYAPLAGCDTSAAHRRWASSRFQSTHPLRGATKSGIAAHGRITFQSTHPLRGATLF